MTEFKQIVGRGTRVHEDTNKLYFTLIDFRGATSHFADPDFDGDPVQIYEPGPDDPIDPPEPPTGGEDGPDNPSEPGGDDGGGGIIIDPPPGGGKIKKVYVDGVSATIIERVQYLDADGKLVTESLRDFTKRALTKHFASLDDFIRRWEASKLKAALLEELEAEGLPLELIASELGKELDPFDLVCHVAFDKSLSPAVSARERQEA